jgi:hypothetical protein
MEPVNYNNCNLKNPYEHHQFKPPEPLEYFEKKYPFGFSSFTFLLQISPWTWLEMIPGLSYVTGYHYQCIN